MKDEVDFLSADKCWRFFQIDTVILGVCDQAFANYLKWKVCYFSKQHVKKEVSDAVDFLHTDKHESLLQIDTKIFWWVLSSIPEVPKKASLQYLYNIPKKLEMKLTFLMQINIKVSNSWFKQCGHQSFLQCHRHDHENVKDMVLGMSSIFKVLKVTSLQCLYDISKKKLWMEFSVFDGIYWFLMKVARHLQSTEKGSLLNFSNILKKIIATVFVFYCDEKH